MKDLQIKDITIIGAGPVGIYAAFYAGLRGLKGFIVEANNQPGGQAMSLYKEKDVLDLPGHFLLKGQDVITNLLKQYQRFANQIVLKTNFNVVNIHRTKDYFKIVSSTGETILTKTICLSIGPGALTPIKINVPHPPDIDINYLVQNDQDFENKDVVIFGGGNSALDWANHFSTKSNVSLIHRRSVFRGNEASVKAIENKVKIYKPYKIKKITSSKIFLEKIKTQEELILNYDKILVQYGLRSNYGPIKEWDLTWEKGKIKVDAHKKTNIKGVWAVGNACFYEGKNNVITTGLADAIVAISSVAKFLNPQALTTFYSTDYKTKKGS